MNKIILCGMAVFTLSFSLVDAYNFDDSKVETSVMVRLKDGTSVSSGEARFMNAYERGLVAE